jgi:hypothetical protein
MSLTNSISSQVAGVGGGPLGYAASLQDAEGNPFKARLDAFIAGGGYRKMAASVLILTLDELTCDPSQCRSGPERAEMARLKEEARPWFYSLTFEAFALAFAPEKTLAAFREMCLNKPQMVREELLRWQASQERRKEGDMSPNLWTKGVPTNCWPFDADDRSAGGVLPLINELMANSRSAATVDAGAAAA